MDNDDKLAHLQALSAAADDGSRRDVFEALVRDALAHDDRQALDEEIGAGDPVERHGYYYLIAEALWLLDKDHRQALSFKPSGDDWLLRLRTALFKAGLMPAAEQKIADLGGGRMDTAAYANASGMILECLQQRYEDAEAAYRKALELAPDSAHAWNGLGIVLDNQNRYPEAEAAYRKALELAPDLVAAWINLGIALYGQDRYPEAEAAYRKALELAPDYFAAWNNLGNALDSQNRHPEAEIAYRKALELAPDSAHAWNGLGIVLDNQNRYPEAEAAFLKALELVPDYDYAHSNLAGLYLMKLGRIDAGIAELIQGLQLNPDNSYGRYVLGEHWQNALPVATGKIAAHESGADNLCTALTEELIAQAASGAQAAVLKALLALDDSGQAIFEPLLLALQAQTDRDVLYRIAREKRDLVLDVMAKIGGEHQP